MRPGGAAYTGAGGCGAPGHILASILPQAAASSDRARTFPDTARLVRAGKRGRHRNQEVMLQTGLATLPVHTLSMDLRVKDRTMQGKAIVRSCDELSAGDEINARYNGILVHRGRVTGIVPGRGLFWIMDELTGSRRLLDMADLEIART